MSEPEDSERMRAAQLQQQQEQDSTPIDDAHVYQLAVQRRARVSFSVSLCGTGLASFLLVTYLTCTSNLGDPELQKAFEAEVQANSYEWPMVAFATAFALNFLTLLFERDSAKFQLALLACYINFLAAFTDYLCWKGYAPIVRDVWGHGMQLLRWLMFLHTTPMMVYLLSIISDFGRFKVYLAMLADAMMLVVGITAHLSPNFWVAVPLYFVAFSLMSFVMVSMWNMFKASVSEARYESSRMSLEALRFFTVGLWMTFPVVFFTVKMGLVSIATEEWMWCVGDFMGKVMFSSSLLYGNFLTIEQRRLISMRIVEESNRIQVIQELKDLVEQKERFMSSMSHELRTPLNGIIGLSDALLVGSCGEVNEQVSKTITTIKTSGSRLLNLINDILDAASMRKGKLTVKHEKVNLAKIVDDVIELTQPLAKRGVKMLNDVPESLPFVLGDQSRIIQIFHNLLGNSCKFTHQGYIAVSANVRFDEVEVAVSDSGIGIPDDKFDQIFMAFEQVDMSTTRKYGGTGLGLNLVKQLVEAHGGAISVKSKLGQGTTFYFSLKMWDDTSHGDSTAEPSANVSQHLGAAATATATTAGSKDGPAAAAAAGATATATGAGSVVDEPRMKRPTSTRVAHSARISAASATATAGSPEASAAGSRVVRTSQGAAAAPPPPRPKSTMGVNVAGPVTLGDAITLTRSSVGLKGVKSRASDSAKVRVLSVDDDPVNQMVIQNLLAPAGYEITQAMDGQEALALLKDEKELPDVILLDVMMPGMSGYEVCRKLREMYPLSCIPVIMISAKSKEEHIVEGLAAGSNDYVVKPFGRQEILARIAAHLRFKDEVFTAGEMWGEAVPADQLATAEHLQALMHEDCPEYSLPLCMRLALEGGKLPTMQMFEHVSLACIGLTNLEELAQAMAPEELLKALAVMYKQVDSLLSQHNCYWCQGLDGGKFKVVAGLDRQPDHADRILQFSKALVALASAVPLPHDCRLQLAVGVHTAAAQGVVVGVAHPVLRMTGGLVVEALKLQDTCPPNCIHVSNKVYDATSLREELASGIRASNGSTYLVSVGAWRTGLQQLKNMYSSYISKYPQGRLNAGAKRLRPIQVAMVTMALEAPTQLMEALLTRGRLGSEASLSGLLVAAAAARISRSAPGSTDLQPPPTPGGSHGGSGGGPAAAARLAHEKEVLERQLEEVSQEADRLQDLVDRLEADLVTAKAELAKAQSELQAAAAAGPAATAPATAEVEALRDEVGALRQHCAELEAELDAQMAGRATAERELREVREACEREVREAVAHVQAVVAQAATQQQAAAEREREQAAEREYVMQQLQQGAGVAPGALGRRGSGASAAEAWEREVHGHSQPIFQHASPAAHQPPRRHASTLGPGLLLPRAAFSPPVDRERELDAMSQASLASDGGLLAGPYAGSRSLHYHQHQHQQQQSRSFTGARPGAGAEGYAAFMQHRHSGLAQVRASPTQAMPRAMAPPPLHLLGHASARGASEDMRLLLQELGLEALTPRFEAEGVTPALLPYLDDGAMRELGVGSVGARLRLRLAGQAVLQHAAGVTVPE